MIAHQLNNEGIPAPLAGRRGSGSWAPSAVRTILLNARYRGVYIHRRIKKVRAEQKRLAKAVALADDVPELVTELRQRAARIQHVEAQILSAKRTPDELKSLVAQIETSSRAKLMDLRAALADERDRREAFLALFPAGLSFSPTRTPGGRSGRSAATSISGC